MNGNSPAGRHQVEMVMDKVAEGGVKDGLLASGAKGPECLLGSWGGLPVLKDGEHVESQGMAGFGFSGGAIGANQTAFGGGKMGGARMG